MAEDSKPTSTRLITEDQTIHPGLHIRKGELVLAVILTLLYITTSLLHFAVIIQILTGMTFAMWLVFRASHFAIDGLESLGALAGLTAYAIGVLSSLASNTPEAVISALTAIRGLMVGTPELVEIAVLSVIMAAGFNIFLLGGVVVLSARKKGYIEVPLQVIEDDADLIRWTIVAMALLFALGLAHYISAIGSGTPPALIALPQAAGLMMVISYVIYTIFSFKREPTHLRTESQLYHPKKTAILLTIMGFIGIFIAGYVFTNSIEHAFTYFPFGGILPQQRIVIMAMIVGAAGAIPEHGIAIIAATREKAGIALGNTLGGTTQVLLLIVGGVSIFLPLGLDVAVLLQFATAAGSLWFLIRALTDDQRVDVFEGAMILLMQTFVFILILTPI